IPAVSRRFEHAIVWTGGDADDQRLERALELGAAVAAALPLAGGQRLALVVGLQAVIAGCAVTREAVLLELRALRRGSRARVVDGVPVPLGHGGGVATQVIHQRPPRSEPMPRGARPLPLLPSPRSAPSATTSRSTIDPSVKR